VFYSDYSHIYHTVVRDQTVPAAVCECAFLIRRVSVKTTAIPWTAPVDHTQGHVYTNLSIKTATIIRA
jgi:hypothetical protein